MTSEDRPDLADIYDLPRLSGEGGRRWVEALHAVDGQQSTGDDAPF